MSKRYVIKSFIWGAGAKIFDAMVKFISVPLLLTYYGEADFGLISLVTSINAYLQLLDLGVNLGAIKYFSEWIAEKKYDLLDSTARTSISFYGVIGVVNALVLIIVACFGLSLFSITLEQANVLRNLLYILAAFAVLNWSTSVFNQLLTANEDIKYIQKISLLKTIANLLIIYITIGFELSIEVYFVLFCFANSFIVIPYYFKAKKAHLIQSFFPKRDWKNFKYIFKYSLAIVAMGVFQISATKLRPILLGIFSSDAAMVNTEYRIMETITLFIISIGGMFISIFLPLTSKLVLENNQEKINRFAYKTTQLTSIVCVCLCLPFIVAGKEILELYVGKQYVHLYPWLSIWVVTILFYLHNSPIASLVLSTGKTRMLVISSAISCIVSVVVNIVCVEYFQVGSAVIGFSTYIFLQMSFYYFYFNTKVLKVNSSKIFMSFSVPAIMGAVAIVPIIFIGRFSITSLYLALAAKVLVWGVVYISLLVLTKTLRFNDFLAFIKDKKNG